MPHFKGINIYSLVNEYTICVIFSANIFASVAMLPKHSQNGQAKCEKWQKGI